MSHFAKVENGVVTQVIVAEQDFINTLSGTWVQTSYNTFGGIHYNQFRQPDGGVPLRKNYAGIGYIYDAQYDAFYAPNSSPTLQLNKTTFLWEPKPEFSPLYFVYADFDVTELPTVAAGQILSIGSVKLPGRCRILLTSVPAPGVYEWNEAAGTLTLVPVPENACAQSQTNSKSVHRLTSSGWVKVPL